MKTKVRTYERNGKKIVIVGVAHIGTKEYYSEIQKRLDSFHPECVLFERVKGANKNIKLMEMFELIAGVLEVSNQKTEITYNEKWVHCDLHYDLLVSAKGGPIGAEFNSDEHDEMKGFLIENKRLFRGIFKLLAPALPFVFSLKNEPVILDLRNSYVLITAFEVLKTNNEVCIFYGDAHYRGIEKFIKSVGFKLVSKETMNPFK